ncbi:N-acetylmuramoyl-L-alanine amidase [Phocaeicola vulgatus]|uniref:N-acetylmuramoyl-L-alanine amidase n=1 Tax=Phocaeicola vulgatus TaxID=821 RepID=A0A7J5G7Z1_PHOVU|nr:N-acetylmuramoyl-L-alanine amidase [Phocaeicola vulgatus]KAB3863649.1 N-acetylmuramoyl-L-alanine amidase [Phocaeicola vulgatus]
MRNTILMIIMMALGTVRASAQFYTITKETEVMPVFVKKTAVRADNKEETESYTVRKEAKDTLVALVGKYRHNTPVARNSDKSTSLKMPKDISSFPLLTIPNLYEEIRRNGIQYPKIVLAQAILETGWFRSSVCRNKHNLFGLTNPQTGKYYEFDHWTESVRAYYTKVQYKYKGGNYLLWLKEIGYAEDPGYIQAVSRILSEYL